MIRRALYRWTAHRPCRLISRDGTPYLERYLVGRIGPFTCYLHRFVAGDGDAQVHDHPWHALAAVIVGEYRERVAQLSGPEGLRDRRRTVRWLNWIRPHTLHQIERTEPETWTLFIHGPRRKGWGFCEQVQDSAGGPATVIYHQPDPTPWRAEEWHHAPRGENAGRAPLEKTNGSP